MHEMGIVLHLAKTLDQTAEEHNLTAIGKVVCGNAAARHDNSHNNTLLKAR